MSNFYAGMLVRHGLTASEARAFLDRLTRLPFNVSLCIATREKVFPFDCARDALTWLAELALSPETHFSIATHETIVRNAPRGASEAWQRLLAEPYWIQA